MFSLHMLKEKDTSQARTNLYPSCVDKQLEIIFA